MSDTGGELRQKLEVAADLNGVVRTMKAMAASSIGKYEQAVRALTDYDKAVKLSLAVLLREISSPIAIEKTTVSKNSVAHAIVFGSDQGLVGKFNDVIAQFAIETLAELGGSAVVWAVGERVHGRLAQAGLRMKGLFQVPNDVSGITALMGRLQVQTETAEIYTDGEPLYVFHNSPRTGAAYQPLSQRLLPLDRTWRDAMMAWRWPTLGIPDMLGERRGILPALVREYLFIALFQSCAESLASENASRLAAMQRAEKNISELTEDLTRRFHRARQTSIDEELFDVVSGFEGTLPHAIGG